MYFISIFSSGGIFLEGVGILYIMNDGFKGSKYVLIFIHFMFLF